MRVSLAVCVGLLGSGSLAQPVFMPLSRAVERPWAPALHAAGAGTHTAIRPYRHDELAALPVADSLRPTAVLPALDRWSGRATPRTWRWGPLADAVAGASFNEEDVMKYRAGLGFWAQADAGKNLSFHLDAQGWSERLPDHVDALAYAAHVTPAEGYAYRDGPDVRHFDVNGHVSWDPGRFFNITAGRGRNAFGEGHRSLMLSDGTYAYPYLRITTTVWKVRYVNLFARMSDISGHRGDIGTEQGKFTSMHYLSWNVLDRLNVALFEAIVWSPGDSLHPRGFDFNYVNPIIFYRPVEYQQGSPDNALLGAAINVKVGRSGLIYSQLVLDELLMKEVRAGDGWYANKQAVQLGVVLHDAFRMRGLRLRGEWNFVRPFMYAHGDPVQNFAHYGQPLAHPYGSNFQEAVAHAGLDRGRWSYGLRASMAWLGTDTDRNFGNDIFRPDNDRGTLANGRPRTHGYRVGMGRLQTLFHGELSAGLLLDPATATRLEAAFMLRHHAMAGGAEHVTAFARLGLVCHFRERHPEQAVRYVLP
ncbi:MAG: hypothetical protein RBT71_02580 [Flavobacteriales bacterium]|jgi:hypothetical protein|nr:hypothetical protein [Flavobacteriales bacterium]